MSEAKRRCVVIPDKLWQAIREKADEKEITISDAIRRAVEQYVETGDGADTGKSKGAV